jgi:hypothetical protein
VRSSFIVALGLLLASREAAAHEGSHESMPHQVTIGLTPLYVARLAGRHPALTDGPIDELNVGAVGVMIGYGHTFWRHLEVRVRSEYLKPFPGRDALDEGLHEFRGVLGFSGVLPLGSDQLQLAFGPEAGVAAWRLTVAEDDALGESFEASHALGYTLAFNTSLRYFMTYHTGFWLELGFGYSDASRAGEPGDGIASRWPLKVTVGWADRF